MATLTTAHALKVLGRRIGPWIALADAGDAMLRSARLAGLEPASASALSDADLLALEADGLDPFLDVAELRCWESILGNATATGLRDVGLDDDPREVRDAAREKLKALGKYARDVYGVGLSTLSVGTIGLNFQAGADDDETAADED